MKTCFDETCIPICSMCKHYKSSDDYKPTHSGLCRLKNEPVVSHGYCNDFHCVLYDKQETEEN